MTRPERRTVERQAIDCQVGYFHLPPSLHSPIFRTVNLSRVGACLEAPTCYVPGAALSFHLITPDHRVADIRAQVVHVKWVTPELYHVGVRFTHLAPRDQDILAQQLQSVYPLFQ
jgi:hypothetical protein